MDAEPVKSQKRITIFELSMFVVFLFVVGYLFVFPYARISYYEYRASKVIALIEEYKKSEGRYPGSLSEVGVSDDEWLLYQPSHEVYTLSFSAGMYWYLNTYSSKGKEWYIQD